MLRIPSMKYISFNKIHVSVVPPQETLESCSTNEPIRYLRTHFTVYQRRELEKVFSQSKYISSQKRQTLSERLGVSEDIIQVKIMFYSLTFYTLQSLPLNSQVNE